MICVHYNIAYNTRSYTVFEYQKSWAQSNGRARGLRIINIILYHIARKYTKL